MPNDKPKTRKKPQIDPEIEAIRKRANKEVQEYLRRRRSAAILETIINKRLPQLTQLDKDKLYDALSHQVTPSLTFEDTSDVPAGSETG